MEDDLCVSNVTSHSSLLYLMFFPFLFLGYSNTIGINVKFEMVLLILADPIFVLISLIFLILCGS